MPDPFEALRTALTPIDPDPAFAARLRARVARALYPRDQGELSMTMPDIVEPADRLRQGDMSYASLLVPNLEQAARFYATVLGWTTSAVPGGWARQVEGQSMTLGLADLGETGEYMRRQGVPLPPTLTPTAYPVFVVDQLDAAVERVRSAGGFATAPTKQEYGRVATCVDNQGLVFTLNEVPSGFPAKRPPSTGARQGDLAYMAFEVPDAARARDFYGTVLGLRFEPGRTPDGWNMPDMVPMSGVAGGAEHAAAVPMFRVDDIQAAVERVRAGGGTASEPVHEGYGVRAVCADDQGMRFYLGQL